MRVIRSIFGLAIAYFAIVIALLFNFTLINPALAETSTITSSHLPVPETPIGKTIFNNNCASCHIGGANILVEYKNLHKEALLKYLENYKTNPITAIITQVQNGKNAMPAFKNQLTEAEIIEVATYVFQNSESGW
ncbi:c-type cytochrome [Anabaena sp. FACHB-1237]|uniref:c-type cytochrome n=1 Tax=Anabaena sp. FACHB-1237 TaxID=2692769 RepID=UPI0016804C8B|nr:c-type cytochrome [Anabaena sp. FACHB-1237]MBD2137084.1 c-type cytochrome [Anabaena sp. FACHB-1237]